MIYIYICVCIYIYMCVCACDIPTSNWSRGPKMNNPTLNTRQKPWLRDLHIFGTIPMGLDPIPGKGRGYWSWIQVTHGGADVMQSVYHRSQHEEVHQEGQGWDGDRHECLGVSPWTNGWMIGKTGARNQGLFMHFFQRTVWGVVLQILFFNQFWDGWHYLRPKGGAERKLRFTWAWKHDGILRGFGHAEYRLPRDLAGFEPVTICFQHRPKMPGELGGGSSEKSLPLPVPFLKQE